MQQNVTIETLWIRGRTWLRTLLRVAGIALVLLGVYNMFLAPLAGLEVVAPYRQWGVMFVENSGKGYYVGDILVMAIGAVVAWFV